MGKRAVIGFLAGVLCGVALLGGGAVAVQGLRDDAQAQSAETWQVAGGPDGFSIAEWGTGRGPDVSLDAWIQRMPASCDIQTIARGVSFVSVYYRCPAS